MLRRSFPRCPPPRAPLPPRPRSPGPRDRVHSLLPPLNREKPPLNERTTRDGPAPSRASMTWCRIGRAASFSRRMALTAVRGFSSNPLTVVRYQPVSQGLTTRPELSPPQRLAGAAASLLARPQSRVITRESLCARVQVPPGSTDCRPSACGRQKFHWPPFT